MVYMGQLFTFSLRVKETPFFLALRRFTTVQNLVLSIVSHRTLYQTLKTILKTDKTNGSAMRFCQLVYVACKGALVG